MQPASNTTYPTIYNATLDQKVVDVPNFATTGPRMVEKRKFQDIWATFFFSIFIIGFIVLASFGFPRTIELLRNVDFSSSPSMRGSSSGTTFNLTFRDIGGIIGTALGFSLVFSFIWFILLLKFAGAIIHISYFTSILLLVAYTAYNFFFGALVSGIIAAGFSVFFIVVYFWIRRKIPFAKVMLKSVTKVVTRFSGTVFVAFIGLIVSALFSAVFLASAAGVAERLWRYYNSASAIIGLACLGVFMLGWINEVIRNVVHVTVSGTFATVFFTGVSAAPGSSKITVPSKNTTAKSAARALTTSFGSVCFGSLLIALLAPLRALISAFGGSEVGLCAFDCIKYLVDTFTQYAFTQVAIYGKPFITSARDTWTLVKARGFQAILNDSLISNVLFIGAICSGLFSALGGWVYVRFSDTVPQMTGPVLAACLVAAIVGMWLFYVLAEVISSGVATTFVCLCEDPQTLQRQQPELFEKIQLTWPESSLGVPTTAAV
ncbi:putative choline transporter, neither null mutation nor overexpression affects choline transport [Chytridiales sp. JEL 0842]|nr:putative choline transporter, neither null mutation nor overexpression affects choline transport [Chytridiales sp. JEL 0842]